MTCFWDGIIQALDISDYKHIGGNNRLNKEQLINLLKNKNKLVKTNWNNEILTKQEKDEHFTHIKDYNINKIRQGHLCSVCDSFLLLISDIFDVNIHHKYLNINIRYTIERPRKTLMFSSNRGHFWKS
jgi:hypothetical protein|uniref:Uncharacterized protein n=1 Tax=viral metagenome TaxID=1070528 RepID=A0A6C0AKI5_9ZZZZ